MVRLRHSLLWMDEVHFAPSKKPWLRALFRIYVGESNISEPRVSWCERISLSTVPVTPREQGRLDWRYPQTMDNERALEADGRSPGQELVEICGLFFSQTWTFKPTHSCSSPKRMARGCQPGDRIDRILMWCESDLTSRLFTYPERRGRPRSV